MWMGERGAEQGDMQSVVTHRMHSTDLDVSLIAVCNFRSAAGSAASAQTGLQYLCSRLCIVVCVCSL